MNSETTGIDYAERAERFDRLRNAKPTPGQILTSFDGKPVKIVVEVKQDRRNKSKDWVSMHCNAVIDEAATGWYLSNEDNGLKCLILPNSQDKLVKANKGLRLNLKVAKLRVIRYNALGSACLCELVE